MNTFANLAAFIVKKLWLALAVFLVLFAVLLSVLRYALPHLEDKKHLLEDYVSSQYGVALTIDSVHAVWQGTGPSIVLNKVELAQNQSSPVALKIDEVYVEVDFWQTLAQRMLSSKRFDLVGLSLDVDTDRLQAGGDNDFPVVDALRSLFLDQLQSFSLHDGEVTLQKGDEHQTFELTQLVWVNQGEHHQGRGEIRVKELAANSSSFVLDLHGDKRNLDGLFYAKGEDLDISPWVNTWLTAEQPLLESRGNFSLWAEISDNAFSAVQLDFDDTALALGTDNQIELEARIRGGMIQAVPANTGWAFRVDQLVFEAGTSHMVTDFVGSVDKRGRIVVNTVKPMALSPLVALSPLFASRETTRVLNKMRPEAELATLQMGVIDGKLGIAAKVFDMHWQQSGNIPGLQSMDADFFWHDKQGVLSVEADNTELAINNLLTQNLPIKALSADLRVFEQPQIDGAPHWVLLIDDMQLNSEKFSVTQGLRYDFSNKELSVATRIGAIQNDQVVSLMPAPLMGQNTAAFLKRAFVGDGEITGATVLWQGPVNAFPFDDHEGVFQSEVNLKDTTFLFAQDWPSLTHANISLLFENNGLSLFSPSSQLMDVKLTNVRGHIPELKGSSTLTLEANSEGAGEAVTALIQNSGIKKTLGRVLSQEVNVHGKVNADIKLSIPLNSREVAVEGTTYFAGNQIYVASLDMLLEDVKGALHFDNDNLKADGLEANLIGQPIVTNFEGQKDTQAYLLDFHVKGGWDLTPMIKRYRPAFAEYVEGTSDWLADIWVRLPSSGFTYTATLQTDLTGLKSDLPYPFAKRKETEMPFMLTSEGDQQASTVTASLGNEVRFNGIIPHKEKHFSRAHLALGESDFVGLGVGFSISADLDVVNVTDWYKAIELVVNSTSSNNKGKPGLFSVPERIFIEAENLVIAGQTMTNVDITAKQHSNNWQLDISSAQAKAVVNLYDQWLEKGIDIDADFIRFNRWKASEDKVEHHWDPTTLPPIRFHCGDCVVLEKRMGEIDLEVVKVDNGLHIKRFDAKANHGKLQATGDWTIQSGQNHTRLLGSVNSQDVGRMLDEYGVNSGIKDSQASMKFDLNWADSPFGFEFGRVDGDINWKLTDGYLTEISDKGSRILTLFSLNSLVRKLSLDFRDVFAKGFFYDDMHGSMQIEKGVANTQDTVIDGGAGEITINGYTNLASRELNYHVSFAPNVTGNLPVLVYFMVNPPTAIAALALDQVLTSAKVISNVNYSVTGTLDAPVFEELGRDSKDVPISGPEASPETSKTDVPPLTDSDLERVNVVVGGIE